MHRGSPCVTAFSCACSIIYKVGRYVEATSAEPLPAWSETCNPDVSRCFALHVSLSVNQATIRERPAVVESRCHLSIVPTPLPLCWRLVEVIVRVPSSSVSSRSVTAVLPKTTVNPLNVIGSAPEKRRYGLRTLSNGRSILSGLRNSRPLATFRYD